MEENKSNLESFITGLLLGAIIGAGIGYFFINTEEGKDLRKKITKRGKKTLEELVNLIEEVDEKSRDLSNKAKKAQTEVTEKIEKLKEKESLVNQIDQGRKKIIRFFKRNGKPLFK